MSIMAKEINFKPFIEAFAVVVSILLIIFYLLTFLGFNLENIFGDLGDGAFNHYVLEHGYQFLIGNQPDFWKGNFFFPVPHLTMALSVNHAGTLLIYTLFRVFSQDAYIAYQLWIITLFILNFFAVYFTLRKLMKYQMVSSAVGAFFFTFALPVMVQTNHIQLIPRFFLPFILYTFWRFLSTKSIAYLGYTALFIALQYAIGIYMAIFSVEIIIIMFIAYLVVNRVNVKAFLTQNGRDLKKFLILIFISLLIIVPLVLPYLSISSDYGGRSWNDILSMLPRLNSWFYTDLSPIYPWLAHIGSSLLMQNEHHLFIGFLPIFLLFFALKGVRKRTDLQSNKVFIALTILLTVLVVSKIGVFALHFFFYVLPGFSSVRAVTRIVIALLFLLAILITHYLSNFEEKRRWLPLTLVSLLIIGEQFVPGGKVETYSKNEARMLVNNVKEIVQPVIQKGEQFFFIPEKLDYPFYAYQVAVMQAALEMNVNTVNGYSGFTPPLFTHKMLFFEGDMHSIVTDVQKFLTFYNQERTAQVKVALIKGSKVVRLVPLQERVSDQKKPVSQFKYEVKFLQKNFNTNQNSYSLQIKLSNPGTEVWQSGERGRFGLKLLYTIENLDGITEKYIYLPYDLGPGAEAEIILDIAPLAKGENNVTIDLVQRDTGWFHSRKIHFSEKFEKKYRTVINRF